MDIDRPFLDHPITKPLDLMHAGLVMEHVSTCIITMEMIVVLAYAGSP